VELYQAFLQFPPKHPQLRYMNVACLVEYCATSKTVNVLRDTQFIFYGYQLYLFCIQSLSSHELPTLLHPYSHKSQLRFSHVSSYRLGTIFILFSQLWLYCVPWQLVCCAVFRSDIRCKTVYVFMWLVFELETRLGPETVSLYVSSNPI